MMSFNLHTFIERIISTQHPELVNGQGDLYKLRLDYCIVLWTIWFQFVDTGNARFELSVR